MKSLTSFSRRITPHVLTRRASLITLSTAVAIFCVSRSFTPAMSSTNPFSSPSTLPYQAPDFTKIQPSHYEPAILKGIEAHVAEVDAITANPAEPTFDNTMRQFECSGEQLSRVLGVFFNLCAAHKSPELQELELKYTPILAGHHDKINFNEALYERIKRVNETEGPRLTGEDKRLLEVIMQKFSIAGAHLNKSQKERMEAINQRLAQLQTEFNNALLTARNKGSLVVTRVEELDGLSADELEAAKADAEKLGYPSGSHVLLLVNTVQQPLMTKLKNRETRRKLLEASLKRAEQPAGGVHTAPLVEEMARLRLEKAQIMGYESFSDWKLLDQMADKASAKKLLQEVSAHAVVKAEEEAEEIRAYMKEQGVTHELEPWDWCYYQEQVKQQKHSINEEEVKQYLELETVLEKGLFYTAGVLYGLRFVRRTDIPTYHDDIIGFEVFDEVTNEPMALFFLDPFARESKRGGAWMTSMVDQKKGQRPVVFNVLNIEKPAPGKPTLLTLDHLRTLFHEFGHALHGMLAMQEYGTLSGTAVSRDFVEFPSQINEKWAVDAKVLAHYAIHHETKQPMPAALIEKIRASEKFGVGFHSMELMKASVIDLHWHTVTDPSQLLPAAEMEKQALQQYGLTFPLIPPRYTSSIFAHIFGGGYSSGYYAYTWAKLLDCDGFEWFLAHGGLTREAGTHFRETVLSKGNSVEASVAYRNFTGRDPSIDAYLRLTGLSTSVA